MERLTHAIEHAANLNKIRTNKPNSGFVYLIQCHDFVKVGFTDKISIRLSALQTGCPYELKLLKAFPSGFMERDEARLHELWKRYEIRGEWFQIPFGELVAVINSDSIEQALF